MKDNAEDSAPFDFWNDHSLEFLEMAMKRDFQETVRHCDGYGKKTRACGDTIEFFVNVKENRIDTISYDLKGCLYSHACANTLIELVRGKSLDNAGKIQSRDIISYLKTLPKEEEHCADHALTTFHLALADAKNRS